jgi:uncharacterized protein
VSAPEQDAPAIVADYLPIDGLERGRSHRFWITLVADGAGRPLRVPVLVARGTGDGPIVGITAAVHGNELNGIPTIHRLFRDIEPGELSGTVVAVPIVNMPGYLLQQREFNDGSDLNRCMPGREDGTSSEVYAHRFLTRIVRSFDYLIDLHTASFGRVNSLYVRADMTSPVTTTLARLIRPQIIVHNTGADGTLRSAAAELGIHAITVEVGDPQRFQRGLIRTSRLGIQSVLEHLGMQPPSAPDDEEDDEDDIDTIECSHSYWIYTDSGGVLDSFSPVASRVEAGQRLAVLTDAFGAVLRVYEAPEAGVIVGRSSNPVAQTGSRVVHLGVVGPPRSDLPDL